MKKILLEIRRGFRLINQVLILAGKFVKGLTVVMDNLGKKFEPKHLILCSFCLLGIVSLYVYLCVSCASLNISVESFWFLHAIRVDAVIIGLMLVFLLFFVCWRGVAMVYFGIIDSLGKEKSRAPFRTAVSLKLYGEGENGVDENNTSLDVDDLYVYTELKTTDENQHPVLNGITRILICDENLLENFSRVLLNLLKDPESFLNYAMLDKICDSGSYELYIMKFRCVESVLSWIKHMHANVEEVKTFPKLIYCKINFERRLRYIDCYGNIENPDGLWGKRRK